MATLAVQIAELAGTTSAVTALDDFAAAAINKLTMLLPMEVLAPFSSTETETYAATAITTKDKRIFEVFRKPSAGSATNRRCTWMPPEEYSGELADSTSLYYPTDFDPRWTASGDAVRVLPVVTGMVITVRRIALQTSYATSGSGVTVLPQECEHLVILDCASMVCANKMQNLLLTSLSDSLVPPTAPTLVAMAGSLGGIALSAATAFDTAMTNEDVELAKAQTEKLVQGLAEYQTKVQEAIQGNNVLINKFQAEVQQYTQRLQAEIGVFGANMQKIGLESNRLLALWRSLKSEYYELLFTQYGIRLGGSSNGKQD